MDTSVNVPSRPACVGPVAACLFCSGFCALIYQTAWLREFRLIFGASTAASAAVLAIFMGGVGAGSLWLGKKVDHLGKPFHLYARLELAIALGAGLTPLLLWLVRQIYIGLGGTLALGTALGTVLRLVLSSLVLLAPTVLMGGTLPAAVRAIQSDSDLRRRHTALLYGANTFGAVIGTMLATFFLFEHLGNRLTLWTACALNVAVALVAFQLSRRLGERDEPAAQACCQFATGRSQGCQGERASSTLGEWLRRICRLQTLQTGSTSGGQPASTPHAARRTLPAEAPARFVLPAAAVAGFAFFLMELVWYRMLGPLLGGSTFTFGLILAIGLLGIAIGSLAYALVGSGRPATLPGFALVCALEALFIAAPFALGDRLAVLAITLQPLGGLGFVARVAAWSVITSIVVLPASLLAGAQFPMLIALLGRGSNGIASHTGQAYAWNTAGAMAGSLVGGFGLLPLLGAPGAWRLVVILVVTLAFTAVSVSAWRGRRWPALLSPALTGSAALALLTALGPTAAWRHSAIGAGRVHVLDSSVNGFRDFLQLNRRTLHWETEGRESSVAVIAETSYAFVVNGKVDGNARGDAPTQVMVGLLGALIHPAPREAMVVGLGTGSTAGWLADVPEMQRVDVVELEPAVRRVAEFCMPVNRNVLGNPKVHLWIGDAREAMQTTRRQYDLIASEPSNPYRAGVASLFTREFYASVAQRLRPNGLFVQWVQAYEVDGETIGTVYAALRSVFPVIETWKTQKGDLAFVATREPVIYDVAEMRRRIQTEPYRSALAWAWRVTDLEGVFGRYVANRQLAEAAVLRQPRPSTDDRNRLEFACARTVGRTTGFDIDVLLDLAQQRKFDKPDLKHGHIDWEKIGDRRVSALVVDGDSAFEVGAGDAGFRERTAAKGAFAKGHFAQAGTAWFKQSREPEDLIELLLVAQSFAAIGDPKALPYIDKLRVWQPHEADAVLAQYWWMRQRPEESFAFAEKALGGYRTDPWPHINVMATTLDVARRIVQQKDGARFAARLHDLLQEPFSLRSLDRERLAARLQTASELDRAPFTHFTRDVVAEFEPHVPWTEEFLRLRVNAYERARDERLGLAQRDLRTFAGHSARPLLVATREEVTATARQSEKPPSPLFGPVPVQARER